MKLYLFLMSAAFISNLSFAGIFDSEIKAKFEYCDDKDYFIIFTYTVDKKENKVFEKREIFMDKKLKKTDLVQLENCIILNKDNWKCGGEKNYFTDQRNGRYTASVGKINQVVDGKYSHDESHYEFNGQREKTTTTICYKIYQYR